MFFFRHPKPVVDRRPVAEQSVRVKTTTLPTLTELVEPHRRPPADEHRPSATPTGKTL